MLCCLCKYIYMCEFISNYKYTHAGATQYLSVMALLRSRYLPHAGFLAVHHRHVVDFVLLDEPLLRLVELLRDEAHEGVVWRVSYRSV